MGESLKKQTIILADGVMNLILSDSTGNDFIKHYEGILNDSDELSLDRIANYSMVKMPAEFLMLDSFFKYVNRLIRYKAYSSKIFDENIEAIVNSSKVRYYYETEEYEKAYNHFLDFYDPNESKYNSFNWSGFWSLIKTKNGKVVGCYLSDTYDKELFYGFLLKAENNN